MRARDRAATFCARFGLRLPVLLAPMAGACPPGMSAAVANAGGLGGCGALLLEPDAITGWAAAFRGLSNGAFQINLWIPDAPAVRDMAAEARVRGFLGAWGPAVPAEAGDAALPDFATQCEAVLAAGPTAVSSIMGLYPPAFVARLKERGIPWFACVTSLGEARQAAAAGADALVVQGVEAGGHRGAFDPADSARHGGTLFALLPRIASAVELPLIAAGGIADGRGLAAALTLGASAVQIGTGLLRTAEAGIHPAWADLLGRTEAEDTVPTRAFSGRLGRGIATDYVRAAADGPEPAPYPVQRALTAGMRNAAQKAGGDQPHAVMGRAGSRACAGGAGCGRAGRDVGGCPGVAALTRTRLAAFAAVVVLAAGSAAYFYAQARQDPAVIRNHMAVQGKQACFTDARGDQRNVLLTDDKLHAYCGCTVDTAVGGMSDDDTREAAVNTLVMSTAMHRRLAAANRACRGALVN